MFVRITVTVTFMLALASAHAEVLAVPPNGGGEDSGQAASEMSLPARGMSMRQVETKFGRPRSRIPSVGDPPITRWLYDRYTVYFEYQYVIHTVLNP